MVNAVYRKPMPVRAAAAALGLAAATSLGYGVVQVVVVLAEDRADLPDDPFEAAVMAVFMLFLAVGFSAAGYGVGTGRWGARQLGRLVSVASVPTGLVLGFVDYGNLLLGLDTATSTSFLLQLVQCLTVSAVVAGALLGVLALRHPAVAEYLARGAGAPPAPRARVLLLRARVLLVTVGIALVGAAASLSAALYATIQRNIARDTLDPTTAGFSMATQVAILALLVGPAVLCLLAGGYLTRRGWARRMGSFGLWGYTSGAVPVLLISALVMVGAPATDRHLQLVARLGMAGGVLAQLIAAGCVVGALLLLSHPGLAPYLGGPARPPAAPASQPVGWPGASSGG